jgi:hypothetical protein
VGNENINMIREGEELNIGPEALNEQLDKFRGEMQGALGISAQEAFYLGEQEMEFYGKLQEGTLTDEDIREVRLPSQAGLKSRTEMEHDKLPPEVHEVKELFWNWLANKQSIKSMAEHLDKNRETK